MPSASTARARSSRSRPTAASTRTDWAGIARDARKLAQALERLGLKRGDRVATLAMNHSRHLVAWYGAIGMGGVIHTINPRLFDEQLVYIANHAEDRVLFYDRAFAPIVERLKPHWTSIEHYICFDDGEFDALIGAERRRLSPGSRATSASRHALLHQRHHRQSQGRALRASLDRAPRHGRR